MARIIYARLAEAYGQKSRYNLIEANTRLKATN
ncbi:uncharacterized protein G2W53_039671 [Senna tora]|uniref:Uncharacterized protein n=1 Tax=Senna tora TaxID=362788 RepID=A0A834SRA9_9FABA|nr:uncharacterized protein G2W53_039671 [Senna tora]